MTKEEKRLEKQRKKEEKERIRAEKRGAKASPSSDSNAVNVYTAGNKAQFMPVKDFKQPAPADETAATVAAPVEEAAPKPVAPAPVKETKAEEKKPAPVKETKAEEKKPAPAKEKKAAEEKKAPAEKKAVVAEKKEEPKPEKKEEGEPRRDEHKNYHVSLREDGKWQVKFAKGERALKLFDTQAEAIEFAKEKAENQDGSVTIHKKDGKIRKQKY